VILIIADFHFDVARQQHACPRSQFYTMELSVNASRPIVSDLGCEKQWVVQVHNGTVRLGCEGHFGVR
jgi:hypothetical protein